MEPFDFAEFQQLWGDKPIPSYFKFMFRRRDSRPKTLVQVHRLWQKVLAWDEARHEKLRRLRRAVMRGQADLSTGERLAHVRPTLKNHQVDDEVNEKSWWCYKFRHEKGRHRLSWTMSWVYAPIEPIRPELGAQIYYYDTVLESERRAIVSKALNDRLVDYVRKHVQPKFGTRYVAVNVEGTQYMMNVQTDLEETNMRVFWCNDTTFESLDVDATSEPFSSQAMPLLPARAIRPARTRRVGR